MAGKYSAGRIFLQVVPSFEGVQRQISREVRKYNAAMEKDRVEAENRIAEKAEKARKSHAAKRRVDDAKAEEQAAVAHQAALQKRIDALVKANEKEAAERLKAEKKQADDARARARRATADALADQRARRREELRSLNKIAEQREAHRLREEAKDKASERRIRENAAKEQARADKAENARYQKYLAERDLLDRRHEREQERQRAREYAAEKAQQDRLATSRLIAAEKEARRLDRQAQQARDRAARDEARNLARLARARAKFAADELKAQRERDRRRGGASRAVMEKALKGVEDSIGTPDFSRKYGAEFDRIRRAADKLRSDLSTGLIDVGESRRRLRSLERDLGHIGAAGSGASTTERANARSGTAAIRDMRNELRALGREQGRSRGFFRGLIRDSDDGASAFRIFNYRILGAVTALPLLVPLLAVAAGGIVAFGTAALGAAAGLGVMVLAFSGIGTAVKALGDVADNSAKDQLAASKTMRNAARGVRDAQQGLDRARQQSARSAQDSSRRIADAEKRVAETQKDATKAQKDLMDARAEAQQRQKDLADQIASGKLDERQALIDLFNAQVDYNSAMASGGATNLEKEQAAINLERARLAIKGIREENAGLIADQKKGVGADPGVQAAQDRVDTTTEAQKQAVVDLGDVRRDANEQAADSALSLRDAQERLTDSQEAYREAVQQTGELGSASMQKLNEAMAKLSPAGRKFALYIDSLRGYFRALRAEAQEGMLPGVQNALEKIIGTYGPGFQRFIGVMARQMGSFFEKAATMLTSPVWREFFSMMEKLAPTFASDFGTIFLNVLTGIVAMMTAFSPYAADFSKSMVRISGAFAKWAASLKDSEGFQKFLDYLRETGPKVWELLKGFVGALIAIGVAMAPIADKLLDGFIAFFDAIMDMDPDTLAFIVSSILGFVLASQSAAGAMQALLTIRTPFHSVFGAVVFLITAAAVALIYFYQHSETFRKVVQNVLGFIRDNWKWVALLGGAFATLAVTGTLAFRVLSFFVGPLKALRIMFLAVTSSTALVVLGVIALIAGLIWAYNNVEWFRDGVNAAFSAIGAVFKWIWDNILSPVLGWIKARIEDVGAIFVWLWSTVGPIMELIGAIFTTVWEQAIAPALNWIWDKFGSLGKKISDFWKFIQPILDAFGLGAGDLRGYWEAAVDGIGAAWDGLKSLVFKPIEWIINTVINKGFVDNFNKLADVFGTSHISYLTLPNPPQQTFTTGSWAAKPKVEKGFDTGGWTGPGAKMKPAGVVHADEFVIRKESTNKIRSKYGLDVLKYMNRFGDLPGMGGYASGGLVAFGRKLQELGLRVSEHPQFGGVAPVHTKNSWHYRNGAIDVNADGHGQAYENAKINSILGLAKQYGLRTIWQWDGHYDHAHFDIGTGPDLGNFSGKSMSNPGQDLPWYLDKPIDFLRGVLTGLADKFPVDGIIGDFVKKAPLKILDWAAEKIQNIISGGNGDLDSDSDSNRPAFGVQQWRSLVMSALARVGESTSLTDTVLRRMNQESSGDPRAINLWDSNAKAGTPSKGLMQVIDPTFATFRDRALPNDIWNPLANVVASMRYAKATYGSLSAAYNRSGGYAEGGLVGEDGMGVPDNGTMMYDNGGYLPPGVTQVLNLTGRPEPVFTADQFAGMQAGGGRGSLIGNIDLDVHGSDVTAKDIVGELMFAVTRVEHGGKFAGRTD